MGVGFSIHEANYPPLGGHDLAAAMDHRTFGLQPTDCWADRSGEVDLQFGS